MVELGGPSGSKAHSHPGPSPWLTRESIKSPTSFTTAPSSRSLFMDSDRESGEEETVGPPRKGAPRPPVCPASARLTLLPNQPLEVSPATAQPYCVSRSAPEGWGRAGPAPPGKAAPPSAGAGRKGGPARAASAGGKTRSQTALGGGNVDPDPVRSSGAPWATGRDPRLAGRLPFGGPARSGRQSGTG